MKRRASIHVWLTTCLALVGLTASSTMTVWAGACGGDCQSAAQSADERGMSCHGSAAESAESDVSAPAPVQIGPRSCCAGGHATTCEPAGWFGVDDAIAPTDEQTDEPIFVAPRVVATARAPRASAQPVTPARGSAPVPDVPTRTIVLLL